MSAWTCVLPLALEIVDWNFLCEERRKYFNCDCFRLSHKRSKDKVFTFYFTMSTKTSKWNQQHLLFFSNLTLTLTLTTTKTTQVEEFGFVDWPTTEWLGSQVRHFELLVPRGSIFWPSYWSDYTWNYFLLYAKCLSYVQRWFCVIFKSLGLDLVSKKKLWVSHYFRYLFENWLHGLTEKWLIFFIPGGLIKCTRVYLAHGLPVGCTLSTPFFIRPPNCFTFTRKWPENIPLTGSGGDGVYWRTREFLCTQKARKIKSIYARVHAHDSYPWPLSQPAHICMWYHFELSFIIMCIYVYISGSQPFLLLNPLMSKQIPQV